MSTKAELQRELNAQVKEISTKMSKIFTYVDNKEVRRKAQRKAAAPLVEDMIVNAPSRRLSDSVDIYEPPRGSSTFTGPNYKKGGQLAWIFEYGTVDRFKKSGAYTGQMDAKPFIKPAYRRQKTKVLSILKDEFEKEIQNKSLDTD
jgi:HK97 gp10 family phage protein